MTDQTATPIPGRTRIPYRFEDRILPPPNCHAAQDAFGKSRGWRESHASHGFLCLRWMVGKRCLSAYGHYGHGRCDGCEGMARGSLLDHARMWVTGTGTRLIVAEPYNMGSQGEALARLVEAAAVFGLVVEEFPELSVWYPPYTSLLMVKPRGIVTA